MAKYMSKENIYRYSWNWGWVWKGFCRDWSELKRKFWDYKQAGGGRPFKWVLQAWYIWLKYDLRPHWGFVPEPL